MSKKKDKLKYQKKLVNELIEGTLKYEDATIYTVMYELYLGNGLSTLFEVLVDIVEENNDKEEFLEHIKNIIKI